MRNGAIFEYGGRKFETVWNKKMDAYTIDRVSQDGVRIKFVNVTPKPPLKAGDVILYGDDNWFCCYGAPEIVRMECYERIYQDRKQMAKGYNFLIG